MSNHHGSNSSLEVGIIGVRPVSAAGGGLSNAGSNSSLGGVSGSIAGNYANRPLSASKLSLSSRPQSASSTNNVELYRRRLSREEVPIIVVERKPDVQQKSPPQDTLRFNYGMKSSQF